MQAGATISFAGSATVQSLQLERSSTAEVSGDDSLLTVNRLAMDASARLDVGSGGLLIKDGSFDAVEAKVIQGFNGGDWLGDGITSAAAAQDAAGGTALGIVSLADSDVLVRHTYYGDSDLTGVVDLDDFSRFLHGYQESAASDWLHGDYDYSGSVDVEDFNLFIAGLKRQASVSPQLFAALTDFVRTEHLDVDLSAVPEPGAASMLLIAAAAALRRRRT